MSRLIIVSNRTGGGRGGAAGGLAVAVAEAVQDRHGIWLGWSGKLAEKPAAATQRDWRRFKLVQLDMSPLDYEHFYLGYANRCLWPLLHFRADLMDYQACFFEAYQRVNAAFAATLLPLLAEDDLIWVHDFHLFTLAGELRRQGVKQRAGLFLHTPFPPGDIFAALPSHQAIACALMDYDLIGFQTAADQRRFLEYMAQAHDATVSQTQLSAFGRKADTGVFPVGVNARQFQRYSSSASGMREFQRMRETLRGRQQIIGVDRLDYSKGLRRRMEAFELMLAKYPEARGQVEFLQIAPLSRSELKAYADFRRELEQAALSINTRFAGVDWTPVRYLNLTLRRQALAGIYRASRVGLVTPMRDGMNLVAKEYVAAQAADDPGVLVLSRFAGAAQYMEEALLINPYDTEEIADAIQAARNMSLAERKQRHGALMANLLKDTTREWGSAFIRRLSQIPTA